LKMLCVCDTTSDSEVHFRWRASPLKTTYACVQRKESLWKLKAQVCERLCRAVQAALKEAT
jgi:hypothetical protein